RNGTYVESAQIALATHIEPAEGRDLLASIARRVRHAEMNANDIAPLLDRVEILHVEHVGYRLDVAAESGHRQRIEEALPVRRIDWIVDRVIRDRRRNGARDDAVQCAGTSQAPEL